MSKTMETVFRVTLMVTLVLTLLTTCGLGQANQRPVLSFTSLAHPNSDSQYGRRAVVFVFESGIWRLVYLPETYEDAGWEYAGRSKNTRDVWAIAQLSRAGYGPNLEIAHSVDDGRSWKHLHSLTKVSRFALFHAFSMDRSENGWLTIRLRDSPESEVKDGFYTYTTTNGGRVWTSRPSYSPTAPLARPNDWLEEIKVETRIPCSDPSSD